MNVVKFNEESKKDIVYCIIDKTHIILDAWNKEIVKNISDYTIQDLMSNDYAVYVSVDEELLIQEAAKSKAKFAVVISTGTEFVFDPVNGNQNDLKTTGNTFVECAEYFCKNTYFFVAGHILDRKDSYYELHHQCYILNLSLFNELNCPIIGQQAYYNKHCQVMPLRSNTNIHDDYTPLEVCQGTEFKEYDHKCHGWNILSVAFSNNLPVIVFDNSLRVTKRHYYPEHGNTFLKEINFAYDRQEFCASWAISPFNSDKHSEYKLCDTLDQLIVPAAGLNWLLYLDRNGFKKDTVVKFYDYSLPALDFTRQLLNWDGVDYPKFVDNYLKNYIGYLHPSHNILICGPKNLKEEWHNFQTKCDWPVLWNKVKENIRFEFHCINLLNTSKDLSWIESNKTTLINITNIFNYIGTATTYSVKNRVYAENEFIKKLKVLAPDATILISQSSAYGFSNNKFNEPMLVKDIQLINIENFKKPTWHYNLDWSITPT